MKNSRVFLMIGIAIAAGLGAVSLASRWLAQQTNTMANKVAVAAADVNLGQRLTPDMIKLVDWPANGVPEGAFADARKLDGRVLRSGIMRGEALLESKLAPLGTSGGLSAVISEGKRAITVRVNDVIGVAGFALPGNYVDIIVNAQRDGDKNAKDINISKIVLERILVLAVAQEIGRDDTKPRVVNAVTLEVTPLQAEALDLARSVGTLSLALRNQVDPLAVHTEGATKTTLFNDKTANPVVLAVIGVHKPSLKQTRAVAASALQHRRCVGVVNGLLPSQECF